MPYQLELTTFATMRAAIHDHNLKESRKVGSGYLDAANPPKSGAISLSEAWKVTSGQRDQFTNEERL